MGKDLLIKVCGMKQRSNIKEIQPLNIQYMGVIFYPLSKRFVTHSFDELELQYISPQIKLTGVFVNQSMEEILDKMQKYRLKAVQLHGDESPDFCRELKNKTTDIELIKAFGIDDNFDFNILKNYQSTVEFFLFDTKTKAHGGSGQKFNWKLLEQYPLSVPYFLSGGIDADSVKEIKNFKHKQFVGVDINSKFEISPGLKNVALVENFVNELRKD